MSFTLDWHPPEIAPIKATFSWGVDYAAQVHEGAARADGTVQPARPWTDAALIETDVEGDIFDAYQETENVEEAFIAGMWSLFDAFQFMILDPRWYWDRATRRRNRTTVDSPRDIYDLGNLYDSQTLEFSTGGDVDV